MTYKKWIYKYTAKTPPKTPDEIINILLKNRRLTNHHEINMFLNPQLNTINFDIGDIKQTIERIQTAIKKQEKIIIYGDYDADGITATAILWETLHALGANAKPYIPHREKEGYGISIYGIDHLLKNEQVELIITVDQGISAKTQIQYAQSKGIEVIITDHHTKPNEIPDNCLIIYDNTVSGAAVAWKLAQKLIEKYQNQLAPTVQNQLTNSLLELATIGIICDLIPLKNDARTIAHHGIKSLKQTSRVGLHAIATTTKCDITTLDTHHIAYIIGPHINATGRLEHAIDSLRLLCTKNPKRANELAQKILKLNNERKELTLSILNAARQQAEKQKNDPMIIVGNKEWNTGIIGLVASKIVEEFYRPTIVWGSVEEQKNIIKASARSIKGFDIINAITHASQFLMNFGGHPMAAGFSIEADKLNAFETQMKTQAAQTITKEILHPYIEIDCEIPFESATEETYLQIQKLKPFGVEAEEPLFTTANVIIHDYKTVGEQSQHLKLNISAQGTKKIITAIAFNMGELISKIRPKDKIDIAFTLDMNEWNGQKTIQYKIKDIHLHKT